jgi:hypothetical protein
MFNALKVEDTSLGSTAAATTDYSSSTSSKGQQQQQQQQQQQDEVVIEGGSAGQQRVSGWELKLVMEYCDQVWRSRLMVHTSGVAVFQSGCPAAHTLCQLEKDSGCFARFRYLAPEGRLLSHDVCCVLSID